MEYERNSRPTRLSAVLGPLERPFTWTVRLPMPLVLYLAAVGLRLLAFLIFYLGSVIAGHHGVVDPYDSVLYDRLGWIAAQSFRSGHWIDLRVPGLEGAWDVGFTYLVAFEYTVVGQHPEIARIFNCFIAAFTAPATYLAARQTSLRPRLAERAGWLVAVWPLSLYWAGFDLLKDPLVWFFVGVTLLALVATTLRRAVALGTIATTGIYLVRNFMGPVVAVVVLAADVLRRDIKAAAATLGALVLVQLGLVALGYPGAWKMVPTETRSGAVAGETTTSVCGSLGASSSVSALVGGDCVAPLKVTPVDLTARFAVGVPVVVFGPGLKPLMDFRHPTLDWGMYPGLLVWMALIPFTLLGLWRAVRTRDPKLWAIALFAVAVWSSLALIYAGHALRQREMAFPATLILTSLGLQRPWPRYWWPMNAVYWVVALVGLSWEAGFM